MSEIRTYRPICIPSYTQPDFRAREKYKKADLHLHTRWSDGIISPERMVDIAMLTCMDAIAITDHDMR